MKATIEPGRIILDLTNGEYWLLNRAFEVVQAVAQAGDERIGCFARVTRQIEDTVAKSRARQARLDGQRRAEP